MDAVAILQKLNGLGVKTTVRGDKLRLTPASRIPPELMDAIKANKPALMLAVRPSEGLRRALGQKHQEITTMRRRLASQWYASDCEYQEWGQGVISCLEGHTTEIQRYLKEGGALALPPCCKAKDRICLIALRRFDGCLMAPGECGFSVEE